MSYFWPSVFDFFRFSATIHVARVVSNTGTRVMLNLTSRVVLPSRLIPGDGVSGGPGVAHMTFWTTAEGASSMSNAPHVYRAVGRRRIWIQWDAAPQSVLSADSKERGGSILYPQWKFLSQRNPGQEHNDTIPRLAMFCAYERVPGSETSLSENSS